MAKETKQVEETVAEKPAEQTKTSKKQTTKFKVLPVGGLNLRDSSSVFAPVVAVLPEGMVIEGTVGVDWVYVEDLDVDGSTVSGYALNKDYTLDPVN
jgi:hypothetical protein